MPYLFPNPQPVPPCTPTSSSSPTPTLGGPTSSGAGVEVAKQAQEDDWLLRVRMAEYRLWLLVKEKQLVMYLDREREREWQSEMSNGNWDLDRSLGLDEDPPSRPWSHTKHTTWRLTRDRMYDFSALWSCVKQTPPKGMAWSFASPEADKDKAGKDKGTQKREDTKDYSMPLKKDDQSGGDTNAIGPSEEESSGKTPKPIEEEKKAGKQEKYTVTCERRTNKKRRWSIDVYREMV